MRKILYVSMLTWLLTACANGSSDDKHYYQLQAEPRPVSTAAVSAQNKFIWLEAVNVADYLNQDGLVYQLSPVEFATAEHNLWASPLHQQLSKLITQSLTQPMQYWIVANQRLAEPDATVQLYIDKFHGLKSGNVMISGRWIVIDRLGNISNLPFTVEQTQVGDGYAAMVKALSLAWQQEISQFRTQLPQLVH